MRCLNGALYACRERGAASSAACDLARSSGVQVLDARGTDLQQLYGLETFQSRFFKCAQGASTCRHVPVGGSGGAGTHGHALVLRRRADAAARAGCQCLPACPCGVVVGAQERIVTHWC